MDNLDKLLKDKLVNEQFSFEEADWNAAISQLNDKPMKKRGFWYWVSGLMLLLSVSTLLFSVINQQQATNINGQNIQKDILLNNNKENNNALILNETKNNNKTDILNDNYRSDSPNKSLKKRSS